MRDFEWPNGVHITVLEPLRSYAVTYTDRRAELELALEFDAIMAPNPHPIGVVPFLKGTHFDQAGHVTGDDGAPRRAASRSTAIRCATARGAHARSAAPGGGKATAKPPAGGFGGVGYSFCAAGPGDAWLTYSIPGPEVDPVTCGFLLRDGVYGHILAGERRVTFDADTGWPHTLEIEAVDEFDRRLHCPR